MHHPAALYLSLFEISKTIFQTIAAGHCKSINSLQIIVNRLMGFRYIPRPFQNNNANTL